MVAKKFKTDHHEVIIRPSHLCELAEKVVWHLDQPLAEHATLANYLVAELAARDVKMVLTGEGGDELFAGYARYSGERFAPLFRAIPQPVKSLALGACSHLRGMRRQKLALFALSQPDEITRFVNWFPLFNSEMKQSLLSENLKESLSGYGADYVFAEHLSRTDAVEPLNVCLFRREQGERAKVGEDFLHQIPNIPHLELESLVRPIRPNRPFLRSPR